MKGKMNMDNYTNKDGIEYIWCEESHQHFPMYQKENNLWYKLDTETWTYIPMMKLETPPAELGRFGAMRLKYIENHKPADWLTLIWEDRLYSHCEQIEEEVQNQIEKIVEKKTKSKEFQEAQGNFMRTYQLRMQYQMEAEEIATQIIYE